MGSDEDCCDMTTFPVVFVSSQGSVIWDMTEAPVFKIREENPLRHMVAYLCMM